jgi:hypothetical protein
MFYQHGNSHNRLCELHINHFEVPCRFVLSTVQEGKKHVDKIVSQLNADAGEYGVNLVLEYCD